MNISALLFFLLFNGIIALVSWKKLFREKSKTSEEYFLGKRNLGFVLVGSLLFLTNINGVQFIGENESVYTNNMTVMAWGLTSVFAMIIVSEFFMPIYLRGGFITTPDFLEERFDSSTKTIVSIIFLISYLVNMLPTVLYGGAVVFNGIFDFSEIIGISNWTMLCILICVFGLIGATYTLLGGIRVVAVSDSLLGIGLLIGGLSLPYFGLKVLGSGSLQEGLRIILSSNTSHLNAIGKSTDAIPFSTLFTGMILVNLNYWGMEQFIVQRTLSSRNLAESQKGIALAALGKLFAPLIINLPGIIAVHLYPRIANTAEVFPKLAGDVLPPILVGLVASVIFGATITAFNAGLNSSSTLFVMNIYKPYLQKKSQTSTINDYQLVRIGKRFQLFATLIALCIAPFIYFAKGGFYTYLQMVGGAFSVPIFMVIFIGFITKKLPAIAVKIGLFFFVICYVASQLLFDTGIHYLHVLAILFVLTSCIMLIIGRLFPQAEAYRPKENSGIDIQPWKERHYFHLILLVLMVLVFILFSTLGIAS